ncbi:MAG: ankyrin repeat domain-containing protein, partial [Microcystis sp. M49629_WE12]|nr:ankyrin repeat domain-containing protein [Microcystis sp. M49629_WE12]
MASNWDILLIQAARQGNLARVQALLSQGANVNATDGQNTTALIYAVQGGHREIVAILREFGADINKSKQPQGLSPLMLAAALNHSQILAQLIAASANVNQVNQDGTPALMIATYKGHTAIAEQLLTAGARVNMRDQDGDTALSVAIKQNYAAIVHLLLDRGVDEEI